jgi:hypothetical protein
VNWLPLLRLSKYTWPLENNPYCVFFAGVVVVVVVVHITSFQTPQFYTTLRIGVTPAWLFSSTTVATLGRFQASHLLFSTGFFLSPYLSLTSLRWAPFCTSDNGSKGKRREAVVQVQDCMGVLEKEKKRQMDHSLRYRYSTVSVFLSASSFFL